MPGGLLEGGSDLSDRVRQLNNQRELFRADL
jgi:hypothetical protein